MADGRRKGYDPPGARGVATSGTWFGSRAVCGAMSGGEGSIGNWSVGNMSAGVVWLCMSDGRVNGLATMGSTAEKEPLKCEAMLEMDVCAE